MCVQSSTNCRSKQNMYLSGHSRTDPSHAFCQKNIDCLKNVCQFFNEIRKNNML